MNYETITNLNGRGDTFLSHNSTSPRSDSRETMKHTQGQWEVDKQSGGVTYIRANKDCLATIHTAYDGKNNTQKEMESESNANLIASAPEMLEMLKESSFILGEHQIEEASRDKLINLIAKAEGK